MVARGTSVEWVTACYSIILAHGPRTGKIAVVCSSTVPFRVRNVSYKHVHFPTNEIAALHDGLDTSVVVNGSRKGQELDSFSSTNMAQYGVPVHSSHRV